MSASDSEQFIEGLTHQEQLGVQLSLQRYHFGQLLQDGVVLEAEFAERATAYLAAVEAMYFTDERKGTTIANLGTTIETETKLLLDRQQVGMAEDIQQIAEEYLYADGRRLTGASAYPQAFGYTLMELIGDYSSVEIKAS